MKPTILFVDDEPNILMGLKRMLRPMRDRWEMLFAGSGAEALQVMAEARVDAVVSDMRMPGMNGPELLRRIMREHPDTVRFALSGYSDPEMVNQSIAPTHRYLSKPCDEKQLVAAIEEALQARSLVSNRGVLDKIASIEHLPVLPEIYHSINAELEKSDPSPKVIGDLVSRDVGMSANILKLVNSAYFGLPHHISSPQQAVIVLGVGVIRSVALSMHVFDSFRSQGEQSFSLPLLWAHSLRTGTIARTIALHEGLSKELTDHVYIAALLHDVGKLLLDAHCPDEWNRVLAAVREGNRRVAEVEAEQLGLTHAEVGGYLLGLWGLHGLVVQAMAGHHDEQSGSAEAGAAGLSVADLVYFANLLDHETFVVNTHYARSGPSPQRLAAIGGAARLEAWKRLVLAIGLDKEEV